MANNPTALKSELFSLLGSTSNLDAATKTKIRNRFVSEYNGDWLVFLAANGGNDTAALRGEFVIKKTFDFWQDVFRAGSNRENQAAVQPAETIQ